MGRISMMRTLVTNPGLTVLVVGVKLGGALHDLLKARMRHAAGHPHHDRLAHPVGDHYANSRLFSRSDLTKKRKPPPRQPGPETRRQRQRQRQQAHPRIGQRRHLHLPRSLRSTQRQPLRRLARQLRWVRPRRLRWSRDQWVRWCLRRSCVFVRTLVEISWWRPRRQLSSAR